MKYKRVIPRDLFNEAKLLKCMGHLALKVHEHLCPEGMKIELDHNGDPFQILLDGDNVVLFINNLKITVNDEPVYMGTNYNSKALYPLVLIHYEYGAVDVFDENGEFSKDFKELKF